MCSKWSVQWSISGGAAVAGVARARRTADAAAIAATARVCFISPHFPARVHCGLPGRTIRLRIGVHQASGCEGLRYRRSHGCRCRHDQLPRVPRRPSRGAPSAVQRIALATRDLIRELLPAGGRGGVAGAAQLRATAPGRRRTPSSSAGSSRTTRTSLSRSRSGRSSTIPRACSAAPGHACATCGWTSLDDVSRPELRALIAQAIAASACRRRPSRSRSETDGHCHTHQELYPQAELPLCKRQLCIQ